MIDRLWRAAIQFLACRKSLEDKDHMTQRVIAELGSFQHGCHVSLRKTVFSFPYYVPWRVIVC